MSVDERTDLRALRTNFECMVRVDIRCDDATDEMALLCPTENLSEVVGFSGSQTLRVY